jgi:hypothetical protein
MCGWVQVCMDYRLPLHSRCDEGGLDDRQRSRTRCPGESALRWGAVPAVTQFRSHHPPTAIDPSPPSRAHTCQPLLTTSRREYLDFGCSQHSCRLPKTMQGLVTRLAAECYRDRSSRSSRPVYICTLRCHYYCATECTYTRPPLLAADGAAVLST